ncbi:UNVERIFIED_ORG: hypothetical protein EDC92_12066 [Dietzia maris]|uniref:hypothetical protein n=1 Tax=Dietzia maris TaxID=37915 RepID=UPI00104CE843
MTTSDHAEHTPSGPLPSVGERLTLALQLRLPASPNPDLAAAEEIDDLYPGTLTAQTLRDLREGNDHRVTGLQRDTVAAYIGLSTEMLFGSDPDIVLPQYRDLLVLAETQGLEHLIQLRAGDQLSEDVRKRLAAFLVAETAPEARQAERDG